MKGTTKKMTSHGSVLSVNKDYIIYGTVLLTGYDREISPSMTIVW